MPQLSCHNTTVVENLCCFNAPGGQLLQTQFWNTAPATGPDDSWTLHGLWPDRCDGTHDAKCDPTRAYTNITFIISASSPSLLTYMSIYWKDYQGNDNTFRSHECNLEQRASRTSDWFWADLVQFWPPTASRGPSSGAQPVQPFRTPPGPNAATARNMRKQCNT
ncbi:hypothetical protein NX059_012212 [Plenodomus lindquistii]|nr:hypothetical protein NX059_012212 [Plenodomus lindquistii]